MDLKMARTTQPPRVRTQRPASDRSHARQNSIPLPLWQPSTPQSYVKAFDIEVAMARALSHDENSRPACFRNVFEESIFVFTVMMATSSTTFLQGVIIINTATIGRSLSMTPAQITWISAAIGLASGSFMLFFGKTADLFGRKPQLLIGMAALSLFSLLTAFTPNSLALNVFCGLLGLGTAIIAPPAIGILFATYPHGRRLNKVTGALGAGNPLGFILGSVSSGIATKYSSWRTSFGVISGFFFLMCFLTIWTVPNVATRRRPDIKSTVRRFDYVGTILTIIGTSLATAGLTEVPEHGWTSFRVLFMIILGVSCIFGFTIWEHIHPNPLLDPKVWRNRNFTLCILCVGFGYMSFITNQFWISLYMQDVQNISPLTIAARLLPQAVAGVLWSYIAQALVGRISGRLIMGIGGIAYLLGATLLIFIEEDTSYWKFLFPALCLTVVGADFQFVVSNLYVSTQMPNQSSLAAGVLQTAMRLSVSVGLAITSAVFGTVSQTSKGLPNHTAPFQKAYLASIMFAVVGLLFVPWMKIPKAGGAEKVELAEPEQTLVGPGISRAVKDLEARPRTAGEYSDRDYDADESSPTRQFTESPINGYESRAWNGATNAAIGSNKSAKPSFFDRWSWETEFEATESIKRQAQRTSQLLNSQQRSHKHSQRSVVFEICIKCLEERRLAVHHDTGQNEETDTARNISVAGGSIDPQGYAHARLHLSVPDDRHPPPITPRASSRLMPREKRDTVVYDSTGAAISSLATTTSPGLVGEVNFVSVGMGGKRKRENLDPRTNMPLIPPPRHDNTGSTMPELGGRDERHLISRLSQQLSSVSQLSQERASTPQNEYGNQGPSPRGETPVIHRLNQQSPLSQLSRLDRFTDTKMPEPGGRDERPSLDAATSRASIGAARYLSSHRESTGSLYHSTYGFPERPVLPSRHKSVEGTGRL